MPDGIDKSTVLKSFLKIIVKINPIANSTLAKANNKNDNASNNTSSMTTPINTVYAYIIIQINSLVINSLIVLVVFKKNKNQPSQKISDHKFITDIIIILIKKNVSKSRIELLTFRFSV